MLRNAAVSSSRSASRSFFKLQSSYLLVQRYSASSLATKANNSSCLVVGVASPPTNNDSVSSSSTGFARRFQSTWALNNSKSSSRRRNQHGGSRLASSRPMINGKPVAFHIRDLQQQPAATTPLRQHSHATAESLLREQTTQKKEYESDLIVLLDMDECLIHSQFLSSPAAAQIYAHQLQQQRRQQHTSTTNSVTDSFRVTLPDGDLVHVHVRPGLQEFLGQVMARYETHIFTAAMPIYANPVLDQLERSAKQTFAARWYREHCTYDPLAANGGSGAYVKNLHRLPAEIADNLDRVVLVDNNPLSFLANPANGILVNSFYTDPTDTTLPAVTDLLGELERLTDVRPALQKRFGLHQTLQDIERSPVNEPQDCQEGYAAATTTNNSYNNMTAAAAAASTADASFAPQAVASA